MAAKKEVVKITDPSELARARSGWQRAVQDDYKNHTLWIKYAEMEMNNKFIDHAREIFDLAVKVLPGNDQLWYKYSQMEEEMLGNVDGARHVFERWMNWMPDQQAWISYIDFELRYNEIERARAIFTRFVAWHPSEWIRFFKFEMKNGDDSRARNCYERAVAKLAADYAKVGFEEFQKRCKRGGGGGD